MRAQTASILIAASLLAAVPLASANALTVSRYGGGSSNTQTPNRYGWGGYYYGGGGGRYVSIDMNSPISRQHSGAYYAREDALARIRAARVQAPCGQYTRKPRACKSSTLSYRQYEAMNR